MITLGPPPESRASQHVSALRNVDKFTEFAYRLYISLSLGRRDNRKSLSLREPASANFCLPPPFPFSLMCVRLCMYVFYTCSGIPMFVSFRLPTPRHLPLAPSPPSPDFLPTNPPRLLNDVTTFYVNMCPFRWISCAIDGSASCRFPPDRPPPYMPLMSILRLAVFLSL